MNRELLRQLIHVSGVFIVVLSYFMPVNLLIVLCVALLVFLEIIFRWDRYRYIPFFSTILRQCKRSHDERGSIYFFIGIIITLYLFQSNMMVANAAILILIFGDSASTLVGRKFGKIKWPMQEHKTLEGSLAFLLIGFIVSLTQLSLIPAFAGAVVGMVTEAYSPIDDNLTVPLVAALAMSILIY
ncbi:MAG TPA: SEC59/DGK1/VTE5 family protein [Methanobacteriaceae archaeon]|nr:SEC59/DGK1/VTE5 family protein [Methanobacteriaceae archaeon]